MSLKCINFQKKINLFIYLLTVFFCNSDTKIHVQKLSTYAIEIGIA